MKRPTKEQLAAARDRTIPDCIAPDLEVLFVGINPGLYSAAVGQHFARPGNRFWPALHEAGLTPRVLGCDECEALLACGCGVTNLVPRATAQAAELSREEFEAGLQRLHRFVDRHRPARTVFLGITAYRLATGRKEVEVGRQPQPFGPSELWVLPNPSGLNAHYQLSDFARLFRQLRPEIR